MMKSCSLSKSVLPALIGVLLGLVTSAAAQQATRPRHELSEIVVTARKQEQRSFDVPLALSVLQGEELDWLRASGHDIRFLNSRVPSLQIKSSFGRIFPRFYIRGLGNTDFDLNASQPVSVIHDGVVLENPLLKGTPVFDIDRIEVLRGPQGTLFGRNTPAGLIKIESARPTWTPEGYGRLSYGRFDGVNFEGAVSGPLIPSVLAARASLIVQRRADWVDNTYTGEDSALGGYRDIAGRFQLLWTPLEDFSGRFKVQVRDFDGTARLFRANTIKLGTSRLRHGFRRDKISLDGTNSQEISGQGFSAELRYGLERFRLVSLTGAEWLDSLSHGDVDGGSPHNPVPFPSETSDGHPSLYQFSQEIRLEAADAQRLDWRLGVFYFRESLTIDTFSFDTSNGSLLNGYARQKQRTEAWAVFASATFKLTDGLEVGGGVRVSEDDKEYEGERLQSPIGSGPLAPLRRSPRDLVPSWDASLRYQAAPGVQPYVRAASSFRAPSIQGRLLFGDEVTVADTERIISVETGVKLRGWQRRLHLDLAAYHYWLRDQQLTAGSGTSNINRLVNAERTTGRGVEVDLQLMLSRGLRITGGASYNYTNIDDPTLFVQPCGSGCTILDPPGPVPGTVSINGNDLPDAPRWIANLGLSYAWSLAGGSELIVSTDWIYRSRVHFFLYDSREFSDKYRLEGGARLAWRSASGQLEVAAFGRNILNDLSTTSGIDFNNLTSMVNEPPVWGIEAAVRF